jgi:hypothetical protein
MLDIGNKLRRPRILTCLGILAISPLLPSQTPPTAYTITEAVAGGDPGVMLTINRNGAKVLLDTFYPAQGGTAARHALTLFDIAAHASYTWDPVGSPISCSASTSSGDFGDPFGLTDDITKGVASGELKPAGAETVSGIPTKVYVNATPQETVKAWFDQKDGLVIKATVTSGTNPVMTLADIRNVLFAPPAASLFVLPPACASAHPPPTAAELIAAETGDSADNWVSAATPGSKDNCTVVVRVVQAKTMAPVTKKFQMAIDTSFKVNSPSPYTFGVGEDGTATYSGGGVHEVTNFIKNGMLRIPNPPPYFTLSVNIPTPHIGAELNLVYRQCFAPVTVLYRIVNDVDDPQKGGDWLWAKAGKYASVPPPQ